MVNFYKKYKSSISFISLMVTIITIIFTAGAFYQNQLNLSNAIDKERQERQIAISSLNDRMKGIHQDLVALR